MVQEAPFLGSKMLEGVPGMDATRLAILEHHEHFDGSGYPYGLRGEDIPIRADPFRGRVLRLRRLRPPDRGALLPEEALQMVRSGSGTLFDPEVAHLFTATPPPH